MPESEIAKLKHEVMTLTTELYKAKKEVEHYKNKIKETMDMVSLQLQALK